MLSQAHLTLKLSVLSAVCFSFYLNFKHAHFLPWVDLPITFLQLWDTELLAWRLLDSRLSSIVFCVFLCQDPHFKWNLNSFLLSYLTYKSSCIMAHNHCPVPDCLRPGSCFAFLHSRAPFPLHCLLSDSLCFNCFSVSLFTTVLFHTCDYPSYLLLLLFLTFSYHSS